jgi:hypothetical protein
MPQLAAFATVLDGYTRSNLIVPLGGPHRLLSKAAIQATGGRIVPASSTACGNIHEAQVQIDHMEPPLAGIC